VARDREHRDLARERHLLRRHAAENLARDDQRRCGIDADHVRRHRNVRAASVAKQARDVCKDLVASRRAGRSDGTDVSARRVDHRDDCRRPGRSCVVADSVAAVHDGHAVFAQLVGHIGSR
jgi:hypothetical protein